MRTDVETATRHRRTPGRRDVVRAAGPHSAFSFPAPESTHVAAGSADSSTVRMLVVLVVILSAVAAFAVGGLIAVSGTRAGPGHSGADDATAGSAAASAIGRLGAGPGAGAMTRPTSGQAAVTPPTPPTRTPGDPAGAVKQPATGLGDDATPATPVPAHTCSAAPTEAAGGSGLPIPIFPLC
jgi:hypothetical protein